MAKSIEEAEARMPTKTQSFLLLEVRKGCDNTLMALCCLTRYHVLMAQKNCAVASSETISPVAKLVEEAEVRKPIEIQSFSNIFGV